jgi:hypothetical protein
LVLGEVGKAETVADEAVLARGAVLEAEMGGIRKKAACLPRQPKMRPILDSR